MSVICYNSKFQA